MNDINKPWWRLDRYDPEIITTIQAMMSASSMHHTNRLAAASLAMWLYSRDQYPGLTPGAELQSRCNYMGEAYRANAPHSNEIYKNVNAITSWLFSDAPRIEISSSGSTYQQRRAIEERSIALDQTMNSKSSRAQLRLIGRDGWLTGAGFGRAYVSGCEIKYRRYQPDEVWWCPHDAADGDPWHIAVAESWDRDALLAWYEGLDPDQIGLKKSDHKNKIEAIEHTYTSGRATMYADGVYSTPYLASLDYQPSMGDQVVIIHAWKRAASKNRPGRYICMVGSSPSGDHTTPHDCALLIDTEFTYTRLPVVWWSPHTAPDGGIHGQGLGTILLGHQRALDESVYRRSKMLGDLGWATILVDPKSMTDPSKMIEDMRADNIRIVQAPGMQAPQIIHPPAWSGDHDRMIATIRNQIADDAGLGSVIASGSTRLGAGASGVAQVEEAQRQTDRVSGSYENWLDLRSKLAECTLDAIESALSVDREFASSYRDDDGSLRKHTWTDLSTQRNGYHIQIEEAGILATSRAGRLAKSIELAQQGLIDPETAKSLLLDTPDLRRAGQHLTAGRRRIEKALSVLSDERSSDDEVEKAYEIDADLDLNLAVQISTSTINLMISENADDEMVARVRSYKARCSALLTQNQPINANIMPDPNQGVV